MEGGDGTPPSDGPVRPARSRGLGEDGLGTTLDPGGGENALRDAALRGEVPHAQKLVTEWKGRLEARIRSLPGQNLGALLDAKAGRLGTLRSWEDQSPG